MTTAFEQFLGETKSDVFLQTVERETDNSEDPKSPTSETLEELIGEYAPIDLTVGKDNFAEGLRNCKTAMSCLRFLFTFLFQNQKELIEIRARFEDDKKVGGEAFNSYMGPYYVQIQKLVYHGTKNRKDNKGLTTAMSNMTAVFKKQFTQQPFNDDNDQGIYTKFMVSRIKLDEQQSGRFKIISAERQYILQSELFPVSLIETRKALQTMLAQKDEASVRKMRRARVLIAAVLELNGGQRMNEIIRSKLTTWEDYVKTLPDTPVPFLGGKSEEDPSVQFVPGHDELIAPYLYVQEFVSKGRAARRALARHGGTAPPPRKVVKLSAFLTAEEVVQLQQELFNLIREDGRDDLLETGVNTASISAYLSSREYKKVIGEYFPEVAQHMDDLNLSWGSHVLRNVYAAVAWYRLSTGNNYRYFGGKRQSQSTVQSVLLAHEDSGAVRSYQHFFVNDGEPEHVEAYFKPNARKLMAALLQRVDELEKNQAAINELLEMKQQAPRSSKKRKQPPLTEEEQEIWEEARRRVARLTKAKMTEEDKRAKYETAKDIWEENFGGGKPPNSYFQFVTVGNASITKYNKEFFSD